MKIRLGIAIVAIAAGVSLMGPGQSSDNAPEKSLARKASGDQPKLDPSSSNLPPNTWVKLPAGKVNGPHKFDPRGWTSLRYEPGTKRLIWFAADETERRIYSNCLWFYDPDKNDWSSEPHPYPIPNPEGKDAMIYRDDHPMTRHPGRSNCVDPENKTYIQFGGIGYCQELTDTWIYDLAKGTWKDLKLQTRPRAFFSAMVYIPERKGFLEHGGLFVGNTVADTWFFDVKTGAWKDLKPTHSPSAWNHDLVYDSKTKACITFANDKAWIFEFDANTWKSVDGPGPVHRDQSILACDGEQGVVVFFGGQDEASKDPRARIQTEPKWAAPKKGIFTDTWLLDTTTRTWHDLGKENDLDPDKCADRPICLAWDSSRKVIFGVGTGAAVWVFRPQLPRK